ncbi:sigma-54 interaction domain-containing protein [Clostridium rectalis]|uniref:sigma-54 interaction domain-containing protein n=1 Tax=Clostridium rectalis TaxID=2040295 RepID=UPI001FAA20B7|nr:sigma 54-interacting transcriptional regulator [Clostridium rectalis]
MFYTESSLDKFLSNVGKKNTIYTAKYTFDNIIGESNVIKNLIKRGKQIANSPSTILIQGESGTGKEVLAQAIHNYSNRKNYPFIAVNCGAIPSNLIESELFGYVEGAFTGSKKGGHIGKFQAANGGTIFLDEIGDMPLDMQVRLLRVLQEGYITKIGSNVPLKTNVRVIAATNKELKKEVEGKRFREDLYYRLNVIPMYTPTLRERKEDIKFLIEYFLNMKSIKLNKPKPKMQNNIYQNIISYEWPGNIRELENYIENMVNFNGESTIKFRIEAPTKAKRYIGEEDIYICPLQELERKAIIACKDKYGNNVSKISRILGISRNTLYSKIKKYSINFD